VFYTSGYATSLHFQAQFAKEWVVDGAMFVDERDIDGFRLCLGRSTDPTMSESDGEFSCMNALWATMKPNRTECAYELKTTDASGRRMYDFANGLAVRAPQFPVKVPAVKGPDETELHILVRTSAPQLPSGWPYATYSFRSDYKDWSAVAKTAAVWSALTVHAKGAWLSMRWSATLLSNSGLPLRVQTLTPNDRGIADVLLTVTNTGDFYAYNVNFTLHLSLDVAACIPGSSFENPVALPEGCTASVDASGNASLACDVAKVLAPQSPVSFLFRISFGKDTRPGAGLGAAAPLNQHPLAEDAIGYLDLTPKQGERTVMQALQGPYGFKYTAAADEKAAVLTGTHTGSASLQLRVRHKLDGVMWYAWRSRLPGPDHPWVTFEITNNPELSVDIANRWSVHGGSGTVELDFVAILTSQVTKPAVSDTVYALAETNVYEWRNSRSNWLLLLLLLPGIALPVALGAAVFLLARGNSKRPAQSLGYGRKAAFVPREMEEAKP
jgi:hypothetical protein